MSLLTHPTRPVPQRRPGGRGGTEGGGASPSQEFQLLGTRVHVYPRLDILAYGTVYSYISRMKYVNVNFPDDFLSRLDTYCERHRMKRNAVLMLAMDRLELLTADPEPHRSVSTARLPSVGVSPTSADYVPPRTTSGSTDWTLEDVTGPAAPTTQELIDSGRLTLAPQPGERRVVYEDGRKR